MNGKPHMSESFILVAKLLGMPPIFENLIMSTGVQEVFKYRLT